MMEKNIYSPPDSPLVAEEGTRQPLATRNARLGASLIDTMIMLVINLPLMYWSGELGRLMQGEKPGLGYSLVIYMINMVIFLAVNYRLLVTRGQTVGKKLLGIKITDLQGQVPSGAALLKRYLVYFLVPQVPFVGPLFSLVNILFIFGESRRCVHDLIAKTKVVKIT